MALPVEKLKVKVTLTEPMLAASCGDPEVHEKYIAARAAKDAGPRKEQAAEHVKEEVEAITPATEEELEDRIESKKTVFPKDNKGLFLFDYTIRGFVKENLRVLIDLGESKISRWMYKRVIDKTLFVNPRRIYLMQPETGISKTPPETWKAPTGSLQRPLRADTQKGERIALANSEMLPEGTWFEWEFELLLPVAGTKNPNLIKMDVVREILDYGKYQGISQWRGGSYGRFTWEDLTKKSAKA